MKWLRHPRILLGRKKGSRKSDNPVVTARSIYKDLILQLLRIAPEHELPSREIRAAIGQRLADRFTEADKDILPSGSPRWANNMQWTRKRMVMDGLLEQTLSAGHGKWKLTSDGVREAENFTNKKEMSNGTE